MEKERGAALLGHVVRFAIFHFYLESCFKTLDSHTYSCAMGDSEINWKTYQEGNQKISMLFSRESKLVQSDNLRAFRALKNKFDSIAFLHIVLHN